MDEIVQTVIAGAPNLAVSLIALAWLSRLVHRLLDRLDEITNRLIVQDEQKEPRESLYKLPVE